MTNSKLPTERMSNEIPDRIVSNDNAVQTSVQTSVQADEFPNPPTGGDSLNNAWQWLEENAETMLTELHYRRARQVRVMLVRSDGQRQVLQQRSVSTLAQLNNLIVSSRDTAHDNCRRLELLSRSETGEWIGLAAKNVISDSDTTSPRQDT